MIRENEMAIDPVFVWPGGQIGTVFYKFDYVLKTELRGSLGTGNETC
jgi:hypothetical protein